MSDSYLLIGGYQCEIKRTDAIASVNGTAVLVTGVPGKKLRLVSAIANVVAVMNIRSAQHATGTITLTGIPADGNTITISDGVNPPTVFEFDNNAAGGGGNVLVTIGSGGVTTVTALADIIGVLVAAINGVAGTLTVTATQGSGNAFCQLRSDLPGTTPNVNITKVGANITVAGMSGGTLPTNNKTVIGPMAANTVIPLAINPGGYAEGDTGEALVMNSGAATSLLSIQYVEIPTS